MSEADQLPEAVLLDPNDTIGQHWAGARETTKRSLWRNSDFVKLWVGHTVSRLGSRITDDALPATAVLVLAATPAQLGWLVSVETAPLLVVGLFAGVLVDRMRRRPLMIATDLGRALLLGSIPLAYAFHVLSIPQLFVVAALAGILTVFFDVADQSYLPGLVERQNIPEGNSKLALSGAVAEVAGPAMGGTLIQLLTGPLTILIDAVSFLVSAVSVILIRRPEPARREKQDGGIPATPHEKELSLPEVAEAFTEWKQVPEEASSSLVAPGNLPLNRDRSSLLDGLRLVFSHPLLRAMAGYAATSTFFGSFFAALYWPYAVRELGLGPALVGALISVGGISSIIGALITGPITRRFGVGRTMSVAAMLGGITTLFIPLAGGAIITAAGGLFAQQLLGDMCSDLYEINAISLRQSLVPDELLGRANATMNFIGGALLPIGAPVAGLIADHLGMKVAVLIAALGILASTAWIISSPIRHLRQQPAQTSTP